MKHILPLFVLLSTLLSFSQNANARLLLGNDMPNTGMFIKSEFNGDSSITSAGVEMMGLMVGNHGRSMAMSDKTRHYVDLFWELIDEILNAILFVLIGLEVVMIAFSSNLFIAGGLTILIALMARLIVVGITTTTFNEQLELPSGAWKVLTWGGLRGGISVALVLQLPDGNERDILLALTYAVVVFSILIQGLSIGKVAKTIR